MQQFEGVEQIVKMADAYVRGRATPKLAKPFVQLVLLSSMGGQLCDAAWARWTANKVSVLPTDALCALVSNGTNRSVRQYKSWVTALEEQYTELRQHYEGLQTAAPADAEAGGGAWRLMAFAGVGAADAPASRVADVGARESELPLAVAGTFAPVKVESVGSSSDGVLAPADDAEALGARPSAPVKVERVDVESDGVGEIADDDDVEEPGGESYVDDDVMSTGSRASVAFGDRMDTSAGNAEGDEPRGPHAVLTKTLAVITCSTATPVLTLRGRPLASVEDVTSAFSGYGDVLECGQASERMGVQLGPRGYLVVLSAHVWNPLLYQLRYKGLVVDDSWRAVCVDGGITAWDVAKLPTESTSAVPPPQLEG